MDRLPNETPPPPAFDTDDDDPIVEEYDVFAAQQLTNKLHLFQYPLRPSARPYESTRVSLSMVQRETAAQAPSTGSAPVTYADGSVHEPPMMTRFVMTHDLDTAATENFARMHQHEPAGFADVEADIHKYTLQSQMSQLQGSYAAVLFTGNEVHLTQLGTVQQFHPQVKAPEQENANNLFLSTVSVDESTTPVMQQHLDRQLKKLRSVALQQDDAASQAVDYFPAGSVESQATAQRLVSSTSSSAVQLTSLPSTLPPTHATDVKDEDAQVKKEEGQDDDEDKPKPPPKPHRQRRPQDPARPLDDSAVSPYFPLMPFEDVSFRQRCIVRHAGRTHSVGEQVKALMQSALMLTLRATSESVKPPCTNDGTPLDSSPPSDELIVGYLRQFASAIHGVWVINYDSQFRGPNAVLREYILKEFAFSKTATLTAEAVLPVTKGDAAYARAVGKILRTVAVLGPDRLWRLKHVDEARTADRDLHTRFPDEAKSQLEAWEKRSPEISSQLDIITGGRPLGVPWRQLQMVCNLASTVIAARRNRPTPATTPASPAHRGPFARSATPPPMGGMPSFPQQVPVEPAAGDAPRRFVRTTMQRHGVVIKELMKMHVKTMLRTPTSMLRGADIKALQGALQQELEQFTAATWILKTSDGTPAPVRRALIKHMLELKNFTAKDITVKAEASLPEFGGDASQLTEAAVKTVLTELCDYHAGERLWHLKTGQVTFQPL